MKSWHKSGVHWEESGDLVGISETMVSKARNVCVTTPSLLGPEAGMEAMGIGWREFLQLVTSLTTATGLWCLRDLGLTSCCATY